MPAIRILGTFFCALLLFSSPAESKTVTREQRLPSGMKQSFKTNDWRFEGLDALLPNTHGVFHSKNEANLAVYSSFSVEDVRGKDVLASACKFHKGTIVQGQHQKFCAVEQKLGSRNTYQLFAVKVKRSRRTGDPDVGIFQFWTAVEIASEQSRSQMTDLVLKGAKP